MKAKPGHIIDEHGVERKVLGTLPLTADGCVVTVGSVLYHFECVLGVGHEAWSHDGDFYICVPTRLGSDNFVCESFDAPASTCYSTREAAEAAWNANS